MDENQFNTQLSAIVSDISSGFSRAYNATEAVRGLGANYTRSISESRQDDHAYYVVVSFKGPKADLFARTFHTAVINAGAADIRRVFVQSDETGESSDRDIKFSIPRNASADFLKKLAEIKDAVKNHEQELSKLYDVGITAQNNANVGMAGIASKFYVWLHDVEEGKPCYRLELLTNNPYLVSALSNNPEVNIKPQYQFNVNGRDYPSGGLSVMANDDAGNAAIKAAVRQVVQDRNLGGFSKQ